jgi:hypothetical protein
MLDMIYKTTQSKAILGAGLFSILLTQIAGYQSALTLGARVTAALTSLISYIGLAYNANCLVSGGCGLWAWVTLSVPLFATILYIVSTLRGQEAAGPGNFGVTTDINYFRDKAASAELF